MFVDKHRIHYWAWKCEEWGELQSCDEDPVIVRQEHSGDVGGVPPWKTHY